MTRNLKEAGSKLLVRRTGTTYKASPLPDEQIINEELHLWLNDALQHMHIDHQQLFQEHYAKGKTLKQIARETDQHPVTLSRHKAAMLTRLREQLGK